MSNTSRNSAFTVHDTTNRTLPPLLSSFIYISVVPHPNPGSFFQHPAFQINFETSDILTKRFFRKFYDLLALKLLRVTFADTDSQQIWVPSEGVKLSMSCPGYDCDWPVMAIVPYPSNSVILFSNDTGKCTMQEMDLITIEYKSKIPLELYFKVKKSILVSLPGRSNPNIF